MASPLEDNRYEALYDWAGIQMFNLVRERFAPKETTILDVGAGWGKYRLLFPDYIMDACEVWKPYIKEERLEEKYREVFAMDICDLGVDWYDAIIMGDVLEHIEVERAQYLINYLFYRCEEMYIIVPYQYPQGEVDGNHFEIHHQDDLTPEIMTKRYPELQLLADNGNKGIYVKV